MKHLKGVASWLSAFLFAVAVIAVYKTFDNFDSIWSFIWRLFSILTPFVVGFFLAFLLYAPSNKLEGVLKKNRFRLIHSHARIISIGIVYFALFVILALIVTFAVPALFRSIVSFVKLIPSYVETATEFINRFTHEGGLLQNFDITGKIEEIETYVLSFFTPEKVTSYLQNVISFTSSLLDILMAVIISVYMLASREHLIRALKAVCGLFMKEKWITFASGYSHKISRIFYGYFYSQALDACIIGIIITVGLWIIGVPNAPLLGLMVGVMNMIPYFGAIIGGCICVLITLLSGNVYGAIFVAVYILVMQQIDGNIIQPRIVSNSIGVRPIYVLLAITIGGGLIGFWGIFFGVPIMAAAQMMLSDYISYRNRLKREKEAVITGGPPEDTSASSKPEGTAPAEAPDCEAGRTGQSE